MKKCHSCLVEKPLDQFYKDASRPDGVMIYCKDCDRERGRKRQGTDVWKANHRAKQARFIKKHPDRNQIYWQAQKVPLAKQCSQCERDDVRLIRHHPDYARPTKIVTLCDKCHRAVHKELSYAK